MSARDVARAAMVRLIAARGVRDPRVLDAMARVPRERFVPSALVDEAYDDAPLPIGLGQTISQPFIVAFMAEAARLTPTSRVLEIGTGSGYAAAVLGLLVAEVHTIERIPELATRAAERLAELGLSHVHVHVGDGAAGLPAHGPYDAILVAAAADTLPRALVDALAPGGRLVIPVGPEGGLQELVRVTRRGATDDVVVETLETVRFVPLVSGA